MTEPVFLIGLAIAGTTAVMVVRTVAGAFIGVRGTSRSGLSMLQEQVDQQAAALEDAQASLASQATQLSELQERMDFTERVLAQVRERPALGPGDKGGPGA